ncbi:hypothetical protein FB451DRAFT_1451251 [Mycena latifolia]|nr:hypothetical protein FB451DRAFT_1451251 [Mycena latifolia]
MSPRAEQQAEANQIGTAQRKKKKKIALCRPESSQVQVRHGEKKVQLAVSCLVFTQPFLTGDHELGGKQLAHCTLLEYLDLPEKSPWGSERRRGPCILYQRGRKYEGPKFSGQAGRRDEGLMFRGGTEPHGVALRRRSLVAAKLATVMRKERKVAWQRKIPPSTVHGADSEDALCAEISPPPIGQLAVGKDRALRIARHARRSCRGLLSHAQSRWTRYTQRAPRMWRAARTAYPALSSARRGWGAASQMSRVRGECRPHARAWCPNGGRARSGGTGLASSITRAIRWCARGTLRGRLCAARGIECASFAQDDRRSCVGAAHAAHPPASFLVARGMSTDRPQRGGHALGLEARHRHPSRGRGACRSPLSFFAALNDAGRGEKRFLPGALAEIQLADRIDGRMPDRAPTRRNTALRKKEGESLTAFGITIYGHHHRRLEPCRFLNPVSVGQKLNINRSPEFETHGICAGICLRALLSVYFLFGVRDSTGCEYRTGTSHISSRCSFDTLRSSERSDAYPAILISH